MEDEYNYNNPSFLKDLFNSEEFNNAVYDFMEGKNIGSLNLNFGISHREIKIAMLIIWTLEKVPHDYVHEIKYEMIEALKNAELI